MRVILTGGTGYIGGAVLARLVAEGHDVVAAVRTAAAGERVSSAGATPLVGEFSVAALRLGLEGADALIHAATSDDAARLDDVVIDAVEAAFSGTGRIVVHTGGVWVWGSGVIDEASEPADPPAIVAWRPERERRVLALPGVRATVVAPGIVHGRDGGIPQAVVRGATRLVGAGEQHWLTVHIDDLADLYVRVLAAAPGGRVVGASENPRLRDLFPEDARPESPETTRARLGGAFADALLLDQRGVARRASELGWRPSGPTVRESVGRAVALHPVTT